MIHAFPEGFGSPSDDGAWIRRRERFYARALGPLRQPGVYHWYDDGNPHIDVYAFARSGERPYETLVTGGMADRPLPGVPLGRGRPRRVELVLRAPRVEDWMAEVLREVAAFPFLPVSGFGEGTMVEGARSLCPGSPLEHAILLDAREPGLDGFIVEGETVAFLSPCFITRREFRFARRHGARRLAERLSRAGVRRLLDKGRKSIL